MTCVTQSDKHWNDLTDRSNGPNCPPPYPKLSISWAKGSNLNVYYTPGHFMAGCYWSILVSLRTYAGIKSLARCKMHTSHMSFFPIATTL